MLIRAVKWAEIQRAVADEMTVTWGAFVPKWSKTLHEYKRDKSKPNPFKELDPGKSFPYWHVNELIDSPKDTALAELKIQLAKEDSNNRKTGTTFAPEMTPSVFIQRALEVEAAQ